MVFYTTLTFGLLYSVPKELDLVYLLIRQALNTVEDETVDRVYRLLPDLTKSR
jgi:hypothetical protein